MSQEKVAMVGTPCEIMSASKMQTFMDIPIDVKIGLFCMENFSYSYLTKYLESKGIDINSITKFRIEKGYVFLFIDEEVKKIHLSDVRAAIRKNCDTCVELTSETSDISVGSIGSESGWSTIIIRSDKGEEIVNKAIEQGYIETKDLNESQLKLLNRVAANKIRKNKKTIEAREEIARPVLYQRDIPDDIFLEQLQVSNFDDLKANVIDVGSCVLCGGCEYICPDNLVHIYDRKPQRKGKCPDDCHACYIACPRMYLPQAIRNDNKKALGDYKKIITARNLKKYEGQDGGVVTSLLGFLLDNQIVSDALIVDQDETQPWKPVAKITNDIDEIIKASGTKYSACPIFKPLKKLNEGGN